MKLSLSQFIFTIILFSKSSKNLFSPYKKGTQEIAPKDFIDAGNPYIASPYQMERMQSGGQLSMNAKQWKSYYLKYHFHKNVDFEIILLG